MNSHAIWPALLLLLAAGGCERRIGEPIPNQPPIVEITGGPLDGSEGSYTARIFWAGFDVDGIVTHYEYAIDPPTLAVVDGDTVEVFTDCEIAHPEDAPACSEAGGHDPTLSFTVIPGPAVLRDTLRVSKTVAGRTFSFDWVQTQDFSRQFAFQTSEAESAWDRGWQAQDFFTGYHAVYLRARDNNLAYSEFRRIGYTAKNFTPEAAIVLPKLDKDILTIGPILTVRLDGSDRDASDAARKPVGYLYKLLHLESLDPTIPILKVSSPQILYTHGPPVWTYQGADSTEITLHLTTPSTYVFGVRAVDQAGAIEPFLDFKRNAFKFQALAGGGRPDLVITEPSLGRFPREGSYRGSGRVEEAEVAVGQRLRFTWTASAESYGGVIDAFSWGVDIQDLDREGPNSGWSGWGRDLTGNFEPIVFPNPGIHVLYVRVRDLAGAITLGTLILKVIDFPLDREVLLVDDSSDGTYPRDGEHDAFWRNRFQNYGGFTDGQVFEFSCFGNGDRRTNPSLPSLELLGRYRLLVWECVGSGFDGFTGLNKATTITPVLGSYLSAGGKLWLGGRMTIGATTSNDAHDRGEFTYPKDMSVLPSNFAHRFLKVRSSKVHNDKGASDKNSFTRAQSSTPPIYETMDVDRDKLHSILARKRSVSHVDAVWDPMFLESDSRFEGDVDTVYTYGAHGNIFGGGGSSYHNKVCALRWHDPDPDPAHGRTQWFGFPLYYMLDDQAQDTFNRSMDWFREEETP